MFSNRYSGYCNNPTCKVNVPAETGFTQKINGRYVVWCKNCTPEKISRKLTAEGQIIMPYEANNLPLIKSLPGPNGAINPKWDAPNKCWWVSLDMADRYRVLEIADRIGLEVDASLRIIEPTVQSYNASAAGLYPYQIEGVNFLNNKDKCLLADDMGLGKTVQTLMVVKDCALVICRASLKYNWLDEVLQWRKDLNPVVLSGGGSFRWPNKGEVVIINNNVLPDEFETPEKNKSEAMPDYFKRLAEYRSKLQLNNPEAKNTYLIVDEAHDYKNHTAARSRKVKEIVRLVPKAVALTGSPLTNKPADLYGVLSTFGLANEAFGGYNSQTKKFDSWNRFQELFNVQKETVRTRRGPITKTIWGKPQPLVPELLRRVMLRRKREDVLPQLPQKTYTNMMVGDVDINLKKELDDLWKDWKNVIDVKKALPPFEKFSKVRAALTKSRISAMMEYIEDAEEQDTPLVVFSNYLSPLDAILGRPGWAVVSGDTKPEKRQQIVRAFQAGKLKGLGMTYKVGGVGVNLTHAWKMLCVDMSWSPADNWQAEDRLCRIGQNSNKIEIVRMVSDHPLDIHVQNLLADKIDTIIKAIDTSVVGSTPTTETEEQYVERVNRILQEACQEMPF